ncbi:carbon monoxide dehydrogenase subunit G [Stappia sp. 28M-7]|jgi:carbon monoxide dehydrogenase subunit G|uniref:SRPBCC family protein n=1 Tax=Stappia sp. 28M-7 TaxID=2762596 RepID=UPI00163C14FB|nr:carbon monoxide dehydrogenase subunit G [Stappia sp. 28M-7]MBC2857885.1 carbon monoxide dehydrogenase subunit G [Stappia sp. 28M-7]
MDLVGEYRILAGRGAVWAALNDADVLRRCIPGCEELEKVSDREMTATVVAKIGPVKATFKGAVTLENLNPPESYTIVGEGKGGVAGFAKGAADVSLAEDGAETVLSYTVKAQVGGKLAQLGSRLIVSTSRKMADEFFGKFKEIVEGGAASGETGAAAGAGAAAFADEPDAGEIEAAKSAALSRLPGDVGEAVSDAVHEAEERVVKTAREVETEVEAAAGRGFLGGPMVWGLAALAVVIVILALTR